MAPAPEVEVPPAVRFLPTPLAEDAKTTTLRAGIEQLTREEDAARKLFDKAGIFDMFRLRIEGGFSYFAAAVTEMVADNAIPVARWEKRRSGEWQKQPLTREMHPARLQERAGIK